MRYAVLNQIVEIEDDEAAELRAKYLSNYQVLHAKIGELDEDTALKVFSLELAGKNRDQVASRLHGIYNKLRRARERNTVGL